MIIRRVLLSDLALQDDFLLVYGAVAWQIRVHMCLRAITIFQKVDFDRFVINCIVYTK